MVYGPIRHSVSSPEKLNESNARIYKLFIDSKKDFELPPNGMHVYTDVRVMTPPQKTNEQKNNLCQDLALAHLKAATVPEAPGQRFIICAGQVSSQQISDVLRKSLPEVEERTPVGVPGGNPLSEGAYDCSSEKAKSLLGIKFRSMEETFVDLGRQLLELEGKERA